MFSCAVNERTEMRLIGHPHAEEFFRVLHANRAYLRRWHGWVDLLNSQTDCERAITVWQTQHAHNRGFHAGIWFDGTFCGAINHLNVDWPNRWTALSYWLDEGHQGKGIMTSCCHALLIHGFNTWKLNRITIQCAVENYRSRAIPERLGFQLDGIIRGIEWLHDHYADHAIYGLLQSEFANEVMKSKFQNSKLAGKSVVPDANGHARASRGE